MEVPYGTEDDSRHEDYYHDDGLLLPSMPIMMPLSPVGSSLSIDADNNDDGEEDSSSDDDFDYYNSCAAAMSAARQQRRTSQLLAEYEEYIAEMEGGGNTDNDAAASADESGDGHGISHSRRRSRDSSSSSDPPGIITRIQGVQTRNKRLSMELDSLRSSLIVGEKLAPSRRGSSSRTRTSSSSIHDNPFENLSPWARAQARIRRCRYGPSLSKQEFDIMKNEFDITDGGNYDYDDELVSPRFKKWSIILAVIVATLALLISLTVVLSSSKHRDRRSTNDEAITAKNKNPTATVSSSPSTSSIIKLYNRSQGWQGQTYNSAQEYCTSQGLQLCSYSTICPYGPGGKTSVDIVSSASTTAIIQWVATSNDFNTWVQIGHKDSCLKYEFIHEGHHPDWGVSGEDNAKITQFVVCCPVLLDLGDTSTTTTTAASSLASDQGDTGGGDGGTMLKSSSDKKKLLDARWYDLTITINSFDDVRSFCSTQAHPKSFPCPYEEICPEGAHHDPAMVDDAPSTFLSSSVSSSSWSPFMDENGFGIVQVAAGSLQEEQENNNNNMCKVQYLSENRQELREEQYQLTHVMCCQLIKEEEDEEL